MSPQVSQATRDRQAELAWLQALVLAGDFAAAEVEADRLVRTDPGDADVLNLRGVIASHRGDHRAASKWLAMAISAHPRHAIAHANLGGALRVLGETNVATGLYRRALDISPDLQSACVCLAELLIARGDAIEAEGVLCANLVRMPPSADVMAALASALHRQGRLVEAVTAFRRAMALDSNSAAACAGLANTLVDLGLFDEVDGLYGRAITLSPDCVATHAALLRTANLQANLTADQVLERGHAFEARHIAPLVSTHRPHENDRTPDRRLRLGYVFAEPAPVPPAHDPTQFDVVVYGETDQSDAELAERIRADRIDVLVDATGVSASNRMLTFARRPVPVQIAGAVAQSGTTGLSIFDACLMDQVLAPSGAEVGFSEPILRLDRAAFAFQPHSDMPEAGPPPVFENGYVTFGQLGRAAQINDLVIAAWSEILNRVPESRLRLNDASFVDPGAAAHLAERFARHGVNAFRLDFVFASRPADTWAAMSEVDIALDPFPASAGPAVAEALWMGAPVMSLADRPTAGRFGAMILGELGLDDWIAGDVETYVAKAVLAASDHDYLAKLRPSLRGRIAASALVDGPGFVSALEDAYRGLWQAWCIGADLPTRLAAAVDALSVGDLTRAGACVNAVLLTAPDHPEALHLRGLLAHRHGRAADGVDDLMRAIESAPRRAELRSTLAMLLRACGRSEDAALQVQIATDLAPTPIDLKLARAA